MRSWRVVAVVGMVVLAGCSAGAQEEIGEAATEVADDVETAAEEAGEVAEEAAGEAGDVAEEAASEAADLAEEAASEAEDVAEEAASEVDDATDEEQDERPVPDQDGEFGEFTFDDVEYSAVARSCRDTRGDATVRTFEVVDGETKNVLHVVIATQNGSEWFVDVFDANAGEDVPPIATGSGTGEQGEAERTNVDGTFEDGTPFGFSLVEIGPPDC